MKTIVLFHRLKLTDHSAVVGKLLEGQARIVHLAYGSEEARQLRRQFYIGTMR